MADGDQTENRRKFLKHLEESQSAVWLVAKWLHSRGNHVKINAAGRADTRAEWRDHVDAGDLEISLRVEVKNLSYKFTGAVDWPHSPAFIVCADHS